ncbi:MAG: hypothetical protein AAGF90_17805 [Pseudomonadota bacterium]
MIGREEHELHRRRRGRNFAIGAVLVAFVALLFGVTIAKLGANVIKPEMSWSASE